MIRAPYTRRLSDRVWVTCMVLIIAGFGAISVTAFRWPQAQVSHKDGKCRIGQPLKVTIPLLSYDIAVNVGLTALFVYLLHPFLVSKPNRTSLKQSKSSQSYFSRWKSRDNSTCQDPQGKLRKLVWKTIIGGVLVMIPTAGNLTGVLVTKGREQGRLCLTLCSLDVKFLLSH